MFLGLDGSAQNWWYLHQINHLQSILWKKKKIQSLHGKLKFRNKQSWLIFAPSTQRHTSQTLFSKLQFFSRLLSIMSRNIFANFFLHIQNATLLQYEYTTKMDNTSITSLTFSKAITHDRKRYYKISAFTLSLTSNVNELTYSA